MEREKRAIRGGVGILLALALLLIPMAACTPNTPATNGTAAAGTAAASVPTPEAGKRYDISFYGFFAHMIGDDTYVEKMIEDKLGINLIVNHTSHADTEQVNLMLASGEMPDTAWLGQSINFMHVQQELARMIPLEMVKVYAPSFYKEYEGYPILFAYALSEEQPDQMYCLPSYTETYRSMYLYTDFYRYDWIKAMGIDLGTEVAELGERVFVAKDGIKLSKFTEILRAFKTRDGVIPATWSGAPVSQHLSGFGLINSNVESGGKAEMYYTTPAYKEYLQFFADLYKEGLIDKEVLTQDRSVYWEKVNRGVSGYFTQSSNALNSWANARPPLSLLSADPTAEILMTPGLADEDGNYVSTNGAVVPLTNGNQLYINSGVDDGKLAKILELMEYTNYSEDVASVYYGEKGVDWDDDPARPGYPKVINATPYDKGAGVFVQMQVGDYWKWLSLEPLFEKGQDYYLYDGYWNEHLALPYKYDIRNETDLIAVTADVGERVGTVRSEYLNKAILGEIDINATWDAYLADLKAAGYDKLMAEYEKAPVVEKLLEEYAQ